MKNFFKIIQILFVFSVSYGSAAAEPVDQTEQLMKLAYERYSTVTSGWYINSNCNFLDDKELKEYEWYSIEYGKYLAGFENPELANAIQAEGKTIAKKQQYLMCGKDAIEVVNAGVSNAKNFIETIVGEKFDPNKSHEPDLVENTRAIKKILSQAKKCNYLSEDLKVDVNKTLRRVEAVLLKIKPNASLEVAEEEGEAVCNEQVQKAYITSLSSLRTLEREVMSHDAANHFTVPAKKKAEYAHHKCVEHVYSMQTIKGKLTLDEVCRYSSKGCSSMKTSKKVTAYCGSETLSECFIQKQWQTIDQILSVKLELAPGFLSYGLVMGKKNEGKICAYWD